LKILYASEEEKVIIEDDGTLIVVAKENVNDDVNMEE